MAPQLGQLLTVAAVNPSCERRWPRRILDVFFLGVGIHILVKFETLVSNQVAEKNQGFLIN
jgi:hypothetical protein